MRKQQSMKDQTSFQNAGHSIVNSILGNRVYNNNSINQYDARGNATSFNSNAYDH